MKLRVQRFPNNEVRLALYPERFPKTLKQLCSEPLISSTESNSAPSGALDIKSKDDTEPRRRRLALSRYGRRQVLRSGSCFDSSEQTERLLLTGTLPGSSIKAFKALSEYSTYASKTLTNWLTRRSPGCAWQYVWEYQKRGALHIHLVVEVPLSVSGYIKAHFKDEWNRVLRAICTKSGVNLYAKTEKYSHPDQKTQADVTICTREPSRYISKYLTKLATHAKAFGRFPPKTWYQISRSLLKRLKDRTETYEIESLSYRQALRVIEDFEPLIERYDISGCRRFEGAVLSWHGYFYYPTFNPSEWSGKLMKKGQALLSVQVVASQVRNAVRECPATQSIIRTKTHYRFYEYMDRGMLSETELLMYIETGMQSLVTTWEGMGKQSLGAMVVSMGLTWWEQKYKYCLIDSTQQAEILKNCKLCLTGEPFRTNVTDRPESPFEQLRLFDAR